MVRWQRFTLCLSIGLLGIVASAIPAVLRLEESAGLDWLFRLRGPVEPPTDVLVVSIDAESAGVLSLPSDPARWPRSLHAELVRKLSAAGASVIVFDIMFDTHREETQDLDFSEAVQAAGNVVLADRIRIDPVDLGNTGRLGRLETRIQPIPALTRAALATAPFPLPKDPIKLSQFWAFGPSNPDVPTLPSMALHAYARDTNEILLGLIDEISPGSVSLLDRPTSPASPELSELGTLIRRALRNDTDLAEQLLSRLQQPAELTDFRETERAQLTALARMYAGPDSLYLDFYGPMRTLRTISYHTIVSPDWDPITADLVGKVVFVGFSDELPIDQRDTFVTVFSKRGESLSGVEIGATAFANLMDGRSIYPLPLRWHFLLVLLWGTAVAAIMTVWSTRAALATAAVGGIAYTLAAATLFRSGTWLPLVVPTFLQIPAALLAVFAWHYHRARALSDRTRQALGYYLPPQVVDRLSRDSSLGRPSSELLYGTCLVTDAAQYTSLSERLRPRDLHNLLNEYYGVLFAEIDRYGGFVSDVVGDSMIAMWASAKPDPVARTSACRAAIAILLAVEQFNANHRDHRLPTRVGIHAGQVLLGDIGAESHFEYRAVGDIVNTATRIQELNKRLGTSLLVSRDVLGDPARVFTRRIGRFVLAGKSVPLDLHDMISFDDPLPAEQRELAHRFEAALSSMQAHRWEEARASFASVLNDFPGDGPSAFYLDLSRRFIAADPGPSWQAVVVGEK